MENYIVLFFIIVLGSLLGKIKIKGISLDSSAVIFVALLFGHLGYQLPKEIQYIGLLLFIFTVGIQAGPGFFHAFKAKGKLLAILTIIVISSAAILSIAFSYIFNIDKNIAIGLFTGALTSTPGLAVAIDTTQSPLSSIGYGVAYPFGVMGVILFVKLLPVLCKIDIKQAEQEIEQRQRQENPLIFNQNFIIENDNITGKTLAELRIPEMTGTNISRIKTNEQSFTPSADTCLHKGDIIKAVGTQAGLEKVKILVGKETDTEIALDTNYQVSSVLVTNKAIVNKTVSDLDLFASFNATIARIKRSGIDITPTARTQIQLGDKLMIACDKENMKKVVTLLGNDNKRLSDTDFFPIALGILLGFLVGKIQISLSDMFSFKLGLTGGVLVTAILLGRIGKTGPVVWTMSGTANNLLRLLGLLFFLSAVGTNAGANIVATYHQYGYKLFILGACITLLPMLFATVTARVFFKLNILTLLGVLTGSMTSTPGLAAVDSLSDTNEAHLAYATVYPIAMVFLIICVQIMGHL